MLDLSAGSWLLAPVSSRFLRLRLVLPIAVTALLAGTVALADDSDPRVIEQRLSALESKPEQKKLIAEPAASARRTLERVKNAHAAGDVPHALELSALAKDYTEIATDVVRATLLEKELSEVQVALAEVEQKRRRTETLLEETVAQRERTQQELLRIKAEKEKAKAPAPTNAEPKPTPPPAKQKAAKAPKASSKRGSP